MAIMYDGFYTGCVIYNIETDRYYKVTTDHSVTCHMGTCFQEPLLFRQLPDYLGSIDSFPTTNITAGDECWNTTDSKFYKYNGTSWIALN